MTMFGFTIKVKVYGFDLLKERTDLARYFMPFNGEIDLNSVLSGTRTTHNFIMN